MQTTTLEDRASDLLFEFVPTESDTKTFGEDEGAYTLRARARLDGHIGDLGVERRGYVHVYPTNSEYINGNRHVHVFSFDREGRTVEASHGELIYWIETKHEVRNDFGGYDRSRVTVFMSRDEARKVRDELVAMDLD
jgi:hypothetical protein